MAEEKTEIIDSSLQRINYSPMKTLVQAKNIQIIIIVGFIAAFMFFLLTTSLITSSKVIEFAFLTISFGLAPAFYFRKVFSFNNLIGWLLHAGTLGIIFIPFTFLFLGWLKINIVFEHSVFVIYLCSIVGIISLFFIGKEDLQPYWNFDDIKKTDYLFCFIFLVFTAFLTLKNFDDFFISWDTFNFWGLDAKYIYEQNQLRDLAFHSNVIIHRYTSFYPLYYSIIYDLYDGIYEQFATWINIYINLLAMLLIYWQVLRKSLAHKLVISAIILIVGYSAVTIVYMLSMYSDVLCSFLLFVYFLILVDGTKKTISSYGARIALLLLIAISFYFIKSHFIYFTFILTGIWILYDWKYLVENFRNLIKTRSFWLSIISVCTLLVLRFIYFSNISETSRNEKIDSSFIFNFQAVSINSLIEYTLDLFHYMVNHTPYLLGLWWLTLISVLFVEKISKKYIFLLSSTLLIFLMPVISYIIRQFPLQSDSLLRYSAIVMYLFPLVVSFIHINNNKFRNLASAIILGIVFIFVSLNMLWPTPLVNKFTLSNGTYQTGLAKYHKYYESVMDITGPDANILIADDLPNQTITNMLTPSIYIRYFMMNNNVGSQYQNKPSHSLYDYAKENNADYILLLSYENTFDHCEELLKSDHDYLIRISDGNIKSASDECLFSSFEIIDLGKAVK